MTFSEAIESIERKTKSLKLRHADGDLMIPEAALGRIGNYFGRRYEHVLEAIKNKESTVEEYYLDMMRMLQEYATRTRPITRKGEFDGEKRY